MVARAYVPERGDVVWVDLNPTKGHEQAEHRPAVVLSPYTYNAKTHLVLVCPITSHIKGYPFEVVCTGKKISGAILSDQIRSIDWHARNVRFIEKTTSVVVHEVLEKVRLLLAVAP